MKKFFAILFIICLLTSISVLEELLLKHAVNNINLQSQNLLILIDQSEGDIDTEEINLSLNELHSFWDEEEKRICYFTSYDKIKNMDESLMKLKYAIKNNDKALAVENVATIQVYSQFLHYFMGFNLHNLF